MSAGTAPLVCSRCRVDISQHGYCLDGVYFCPACSWTADRDEQLALDLAASS